MIDQDIADMEKRAGDNRPTTAPAIGSDRLPAVIAAVLAPPPRPHIAIADHSPTGSFHRGHPVQITLKLPAGQAATPRMHYRRVNQAEAYKVQDMARSSGTAGAPGQFTASIPASYTDSPFPLQYYFELREGKSKWLYPGFNADWSNQPYFVIRQAKARA
jgi:hypothetical protein